MNIVSHPSDLLNEDDIYINFDDHEHDQYFDLDKEDQVFYSSNEFLLYHDFENVIYNTYFYYICFQNLNEGLEFIIDYVISRRIDRISSMNFIESNASDHHGIWKWWKKILKDEEGC